MSLIYIKKHESNANKWIYNGYYNAWEKLGFKPIFFNDYREIKEKEYYIMTTDWMIETDFELEVIERAKKSIVFVQPTKFVYPWSQHPNYMCNLKEKHKILLNSMENVHKWTFVDFEQTEFYSFWDKLYKYPLAFDNISYSNYEYKSEYCYDICYVGGRANNGFDEKYRIMLDTFKPFMKTELKCGFFLDKNLSHEQEKNILFNSKICLNIHDAYQEKLGLDTNERTFKSLGINGAMVSRDNSQMNSMFPNLKTSKNYEGLVENTLELLESNNLEDIKEQNRTEIILNHTYVNRVTQMLRDL